MNAIGRSSSLVASAIAVLIALGPATAARAQDAPDAKAWGDRAMAVLQTRGIEGLLDVVEKESQLGQLAAQQMRDARSRLVRDWEQGGSVLGWEYVGDVSLGSSLKSVCYLVRGKNIPTLVAFRMYRAEQGWNVINFTFFAHDRIREHECHVHWK